MNTIHMNFKLSVQQEQDVACDSGPIAKECTMKITQSKQNVANWYGKEFRKTLEDLASGCNRIAAIVTPRSP